MSDTWTTGIRDRQRLEELRKLLVGLDRVFGSDSVSGRRPSYKASKELTAVIEHTRTDIQNIFAAKDKIKMRTQEEILARIQAVKDIDWIGTIQGDLADFLTFKNAKPLLKDGVGDADWKQYPADPETITKLMWNYMPFAWDKANNCRGLSAGRSIHHMQAWLWMLGEDDVVEAIEEYNLYGKPQLRAICRHFDWPWQKWDNDRWTNEEGEKGTTADQIEDIQLPWKSSTNGVMK